jgi:multicomponent K+:H+ antiporter subunit E
MKFLQRPWLPYPLTSALLFLLWLLLNQSLEPAQLLLALLVAMAAPLLTRGLRPLGDPQLSRPWLLLRLLASSLVEIVRSCFSVAQIILFFRKDKLHSQFIRVPLDLRDPYGLALLSCLLNTTPGTVWVELQQHGSVLSLHVFDVKDEQWWIDTIKRRYEAPIIRIFEGREP